MAKDTATSARHWDTAALDRFIHGFGGDKDSLKRVTQSLRRANAIFLYHHESAGAALRGILSDVPNNLFQHLNFMFGASDRQDDFDAAMVKSEAHLHGCIHTVRNNFDLFAQLLNGLVRTEPLPVKRAAFREEFLTSLPDSSLKSELLALLNSHWFQYARGFSNTAKHRSIVRHAFNISTEGLPSGIVIDAFEYEAAWSFPQYRLEEVLVGMLGLERKLGSCGVLLNAEIGV